MPDLLGPANAANITTVRPADTRVFSVDDTFFKDCSSPSSRDGTAVQAAFLNGILEQIRHAIRGMGVAENNADDDMLLKAIQAAAAGALTEAQLLALMPVFPQFGTTGVVASTTSAGQIIVSTGQSIVRRGVRSYNFDNLSLANRTFSTLASKTYHLRWYAPGIGRATPSASWPHGRLFLEDLADAAYNPSALTETNAAFDTTFDNALLARVVTNGSNALTVTPLVNLPLLRNYASATQVYTRTTNGSGVLAGAFTTIPLNWSRTPLSTGSVSRFGLTSTLSVVPEEVFLSFNGGSATDGTGTVNSVTDRYGSMPIFTVDINVASQSFGPLSFQLLANYEA